MPDKGGLRRLIQLIGLAKAKKTVYGNGDDKLSYGEELAMAHFAGYGGLKCLAMASKGRLRQLILLFG